MQVSDTVSTRLSTVEKLHVTFASDKTAVLDHMLWRRFFQFPSVKTLQIEGKYNYFVARIPLRDHKEPDDDLAFLPAREEIELDKNATSTYENQHGPYLAAFHPFPFARHQTGRSVKVFFRS